MFKSVIESKMHGAYAGLREPPGSDKLNAILVRLQEHGLTQLVHSFLKQMGRQEKVGGLLVEILLANQLIRYRAPFLVTSDRQDGSARVPCDITIVRLFDRADFQCKAVLNSFNEFWIRDFMAWVEKRYVSRTPGLLMEFASVLDLNDKDYADFKRWFLANEPTFAVEDQIEWCPAAADRGIKIEFSAKCDAGISQGVTWIAANEYSAVNVVSSKDLRQVLLKRIWEAKRSFGFAPSDNQFNFVVIDISDSYLYDEENCFEALFGIHGWSIDPSKMEADYAGHDGSGIFLQEKPDWVSAVLVPRKSDLESVEYAVFPNPKHQKSITEKWIGHPFRFGKKFKDVNSNEQ